MFSKKKKKKKKKKKNELSSKLFYGKKESPANMKAQTCLHGKRKNKTLCRMLKRVTIYSRTSKARTFLGPWQFVRDMDSSSH